MLCVSIISKIYNIVLPHICSRKFCLNVFVITFTFILAPLLIKLGTSRYILFQYILSSFFDMAIFVAISSTLSMFLTNIKNSDIQGT